MYNSLQIQYKGNLCILTINNPTKYNALSTDILLEIQSFFAEIEKNHAIRVVIITGQGKAFVSGADISEMVAFSFQQAKDFSRIGQETFSIIEQSSKVVIAAINGVTLGGGLELAISCDLRIASNNAKLGQPELQLGIIPGFSGTQRLARLIGIAKAKELLFTSKIVDAQEALSLGLVYQVTESNMLLRAAMDMGEQIINKSPIAIKHAKQALLRGLNTDLESGILIENQLFAECFLFNDQKEGMQAFLEKRTPNFNQINNYE